MSKGLKLLVSGLAIFFSPALTFSQQIVVELEPIVVTATRIGEHLRDIPLATNVITRKEIEATNAKDVAEAIRGITGVDIRSHGTLGSQTSVGLRGSTSSQVLVLIDGRPINSIATGDADLSQIPLDNVQRIEIVRGPTSHLYGANALGGVVNIVTTNPPEETTTRADYSYGSFGTHIYRFAQGATRSRFGYIVTAGAKKTKGFRDNSAYDAKDLSTKLRYHFSPQSFAQLTVGYHDDDFGIPGPVPAKPAKYGNDKVTSLFDHQKDKNVYADFFVNFDSNSYLRIYRERRKMYYTTRYDDWLSWPPQTLDENDRYITDIWGGSFQYQQQLSTSNTLVLGIDAHNDRLRAFQKITYTAAGKDSLSEWRAQSTEYGLWVENKWRFGDRLILISGMRFDHHSKYGSETSPTLGAVWHLSRQNTLRVALGKAYRAPTFNDLFWPAGGNPNLKPEIGSSYELGFEHRILAFLTGRLSLFKRSTKDMIAWTPDESGNWRPQNLNRHEIIGGELALSLYYRDWLQAGLYYTYLDAHQKNRELVYSDWLSGENRTAIKSRRAAFIPRHQLALNLLFKTRIGTRISLHLREVGDRVNYYANYTASPVITMDTRKLSAYTVLDLKITQVIWGKMETSFAIDNVFDSPYQEQFGTSLKDHGYPMPGRTITLGIGLKL